MKRGTSIVLSFLLAFSCVACSEKNVQNKKTENTLAGDEPSRISVMGDLSTNADVWVASPSEKILATESKDSYASYAQSEVSLCATRNEYETGQIVVTAKKDISYTVELSALTHTTDSSAVIGSENFRVYTQLYMYVAKNYNQNGAPTGDYPDALLPLENAIECGENVVLAGRNGAIWLEYYIPKTAKAGEYTGTATVKIGKGVATIPVRLRVYDYTLADETTSKSVFILTTSTIEHYELDGSSENYDKYNELLIRSRVSSGTLGPNLTLDEYIDKAVELALKGMSSISTKGGSTSVNGMNTFKIEDMTYFITKMAEKSLEYNFNFVEKIVSYNNWIDEPFNLPRKDGIVPFQIERFNGVLETVQTNLTEDERFDSDFGHEVIDSVGKIPHVVTDYYEQNKHRTNGPLKNADGTEFSYDGKNVALCPKFDGLNSEAERAQYDQFPEKWVYACNVPAHPYPTYHIDASTTSSLSVGWMMAEYGFVGNLYWSVNAHIYTDNSFLENPYEGAHRGLGANGDGWLLYPGKPYGVDGPVSSIRLEAVRDSNEDYELLMDLKEAYAAQGEDATAIIHLLSQSFYSETSVTGGSKEYEAARKVLLDLLDAVNSEAALTVTSLEKVSDAFGGEYYKLQAKASEGASVYSGGTQLTEKNGKYDFEVRLTEDENYLSLNAFKGDCAVGFSVYLGGKIVAVEASGYTKDMFSQSAVSGTLGEDGWYTIGLQPVKVNSKEQWLLHMELPAWSMIGESTKNCRIYLYNPATTDQSAIVYVKYKGQGGKQQILSAILKPGGKRHRLNVVRFRSLDDEKGRGIYRASRRRYVGD